MLYKLPLPLSNLIRMNLVALGKLNNRLFTLQGLQGNLRL